MDFVPRDWLNCSASCGLDESKWSLNELTGDKTSAERLSGLDLSPLFLQLLSTHVVGPQANGLKLLFGKGGQLRLPQLTKHAIMVEVVDAGIGPTQVKIEPERADLLVAVQAPGDEIEDVVSRVELSFGQEGRSSARRQAECVSLRLGAGVGGVEGP